MNQDDIMIDIKEMLKGEDLPGSEDCCIYRVPFDIRKVNEDAYTPTVVSIGPFHHKGHSRLQNMERHKLMYCKAFLERTETSWDRWIHCIERAEPEFRRCYSDTLHFSKKELMKIIFVDSGFVLELFWRQYFFEWLIDDTALSTPWLNNIIRDDLLLLENQLPFCFLENLFNLSFTSTSGDGSKDNNIPSFPELTFCYFDYFNRSHLSFDNNNIKIRHFTDLIRAFHLPHHDLMGRTDESLKHLPSTTELSEAGVRFKVNTTEKKCLLDLRLSEGVLEIPQLIVEDRTERVLRNMVALEQCHYPHESYITD